MEWFSTIGLAPGIVSVTLFPKITLSLGIVLLVFFLVTPDTYAECHSDFSISGYDPVCLPTWVYQFSEASLYLGIGCIIATFLLAEKDDSVLSILGEIQK